MAATSGNRDRIWSFERREYWNSRYEQFQESTFDWLCTYEAIESLVGPHVSGAAVALDIGCGNAEFAAGICRSHPDIAIIGIDYSQSLFEKCGTSLGPSGRTDWAVADARSLPFRSGLFDVIFDKGCLDALCAGCDQLEVLRGWGRDITAAEEAAAKAAGDGVTRLLQEVARCLTPGGRYICVSYEGPDGRRAALQAAAAAGLALLGPGPVLEEATHNYVYILTKARAPHAAEAPGAAAQAAPKGAAGPHPQHAANGTPLAAEGRAPGAAGGTGEAVQGTRAGDTA